MRSRRGWLKAEASRSCKRRRTFKQMRADLVAIGCKGWYYSAAAFSRAWAARREEKEQAAVGGTFVWMYVTEFR